jgi:hypothetical protein
MAKKLFYVLVFPEFYTKADRGLATSIPQIPPQ